MCKKRIFEIQKWTKQLQEEIIGSPRWVEEKEAFEYDEVNVKIVSILKLIRATQGIKTIELLCKEGLFIDMGCICRSIVDCIAEIYFLLEEYPEQSGNVKKFIERFSESTIDNIEPNEKHVQSKKIHAAYGRVISQSLECSKTLDKIRNIYKRCSGYVHADYAVIMSIYGCFKGNYNFNLQGIESKEQKEMYSEFVTEMSNPVRLTLLFMAQTFELEDLADEIQSTF